MTDAQFKEASWDWVQSPVGTTLTIPLTNFGAQSVSVAVSQAVSGAAGTLHTALTGATTTVVVTTTSGTFGTGVWNVITINGHAADPVPTAVDESATTKWGDIGDWDVSDVGDFTRAFSDNRDVTNVAQVNSGNPKATTFVGTAMSKWITTSLTKMEGTFRGAAAMNSDMTSWNVVKVTTLEGTFSSAKTFAGIGLNSWITSSIADSGLHFTFMNAWEMNADLSGWNVANVKNFLKTFNGAKKFTGTGVDMWSASAATNMEQMFQNTEALTSCNKRKIADAWAGNLAFKATTYTAKWTADACPIVVRRAMIYRCTLASVVCGFGCGASIQLYHNQTHSARHGRE